EALLSDFRTLRDKYGVDSLRVREGKVEFSTFDKRPLPSDAEGTRLLQHAALLAPSLVLSAHLSQDGIFSSIVWSVGATSGRGVAHINDLSQEPLLKQHGFGFEAVPGMPGWYFLAL